MSDPNDISQLLGLSPADLNSLMAQFQPSEEDKKAARQQMFFQAAAGLLGNMYKPTGMGLAAGLQGGLLGYNSELKDRTQQRGQNLTQALALKNAAQKTRMDAMGMDLMNGGSGLPGAPAAGPTPALGAPPAMGPPSAGGEMSQSLPTAMSTSQLGIPNWRQTVPREQIGAAIASGDWKKVSDVIGEGSKLNIGREGTISVGNTVVGRMLPSGGAIMYQNGDMSKPVFFRDPQEAFKASADMAGGITAAQEASKNPYQISEAQDAQGRTVKGYAPQLFGPPPVPQTGGTPTAGTLSPAELQWAQSQASGQPARVSTGYNANGSLATAPLPQASTGGPMVGANPVALKAAESEATGRAEALGKQPQAIDEAAQTAQTILARTAEVRNLLKSYKPGALTPLRGNAGAIAEAVGLPQSVVEGIAGGSPAAIQATTKANIDAAFESAKAALTNAGGTGAGRVTQAEILLKAKTQPGVALTPEANNILLDFQEGVATRSMDMQAAKEDWLADPANRGSMAGFAAKFNKEHPLNNYVPSAEKLQETLFPNGAAKPSQSAGKKYGGNSIQELADEARKRGIIR